jgi:hypothetical protein
MRFLTVVSMISVRYCPACRRVPETESARFESRVVLIRIQLISQVTG